MIELKDRHGNVYYIRASLVLAVFEREGNTSEIVMQDGTRATCISAPHIVYEKINAVILSPENL